MFQYVCNLPRGYAPSPDAAGAPASRVRTRQILKRIWHLLLVFFIGNYPFAVRNEVVPSRVSVRSFAVQILLKRIAWKFPVPHVLEFMVRCACECRLAPSLSKGGIRWFASSSKFIAVCGAVLLLAYGPASAQMLLPGGGWYNSEAYLYDGPSFADWYDDPEIYDDYGFDHGLYDGDAGRFRDDLNPYDVDGDWDDDLDVNVDDGVDSIIGRGPYEEYYDRDIDVYDGQKKRW